MHPSSASSRLQRRLLLLNLPSASVASHAHAGYGPKQRSASTGADGAASASRPVRHPDAGDADSLLNAHRR